MVPFYNVIRYSIVSAIVFNYDILMAKSLLSLELLFCDPSHFSVHYTQNSVELLLHSLLCFY